MSFKKNTAVTGFPFGMVSATDGSDITTGTPVGYYTLDGGTQTAIGDVTPVHEGNGQWTVDLTAGEMNGDIIGLVFTHTSAVTVPFTIKTSVLTTDDTLLVDMVAISGDTTAADNLEAMYDGTGYTDDTAPASRSQVSSLSSGSAAISTISGSAVVTTGTETLTYAVTGQLDGIFHEIADVANSTEFYYQFNVGGNGVPVEFLWDGYAQSNGDSYAVKAYNWTTLVWDSVGTIDGASGTTSTPKVFQATNGHVGTGVNIGVVRLQFTSSDGTHFATDRVLCSYAVVSQSVGYDGGMVWINTISGTAGTESFVNGVADNTVLTLADALTIANNVGLQQFNVSPESTLSPTADLNNKNVYGIGYSLNLGGHDYAGTHFYHASPVNGVATAQNVAGQHLDILDSIIADITIDDAHLTNCSLGGTITLSSTQAGELKLINCRSIIAGSLTPILDFSTGLVNHDVTIADWQNGIEVRNFNNGGTDLFSISGTGKLVVAASCSGTMNVRGAFQIVDNSAGAVTFVYDDIHENSHQILEDTSTTIPNQITALNDITVSDILTTQMTESYSADGIAPTLAQGVFLVMQNLQDFSFSGTTQTVKQLDGSTTAATYTLDDATAPTSKTRAT